MQATQLFRPTQTTLDAHRPSRARPERTESSSQSFSETLRKATHSPRQAEKPQATVEETHSTDLGDVDNLRDDEPVQRTSSADRGDVRGSKDDSNHETFREPSRSAGEQLSDASIDANAKAQSDTQHNQAQSDERLTTSDQGTNVQRTNEAQSKPVNAQMMPRASQDSGEARSGAGARHSVRLEESAEHVVQTDESVHSNANELREDNVRATVLEQNQSAAAESDALSRDAATQHAPGMTTSGDRAVARAGSETQFNASLEVGESTESNQSQVVADDTVIASVHAQDIDKAEPAGRNEEHSREHDRAGHQQVSFSNTQNRNVGNSASASPSHSSTGSQSTAHAESATETVANRAANTANETSNATVKQSGQAISTSHEYTARSGSNTDNQSPSRDDANAQERDGSSQNATQTNAQRSDGSGPSYSAAGARALEVDSAVKLDSALGQVTTNHSYVHHAGQPPSQLYGPVANAGTTDVSGEVTTKTQAMEELLQPKDASTSRIMRGLNAMVNQNGGSMTMRLDPPDLGQLRIQMTITRGIVAATFHAANAQAHALLEHNMPSLKAALEQHGLTVDRLGVQTSTQSQQGNASDQSADRQSDQRGGADAGGGESRGRREHTGQSHSNARSFTSFEEQFEPLHTTTSQNNTAGADAT